MRKNALVVELVDTTVLETVALSLASSSLARGTNNKVAELEDANLSHRVAGRVG